MSYDPDEMMLELFRAEVESHSDSLTNSLLKLEQDPTDTGLLAGMMRAAHSIKGAARIVRVDAAVDVAHVMEDCFVAAQRGELVLEPAGIDILLRSVDLLGQISDASKNPNFDWNSLQPAIKSTVSSLRNVLQGQPLVTVAAPAISVDLQNQHQPEKQPSTMEPRGTETLPTVLPTPSPSRFVTSPGLVSIPALLNILNAESIRVQLLSALECEANHDPVVIDLALTKDLDAVGLALMHSVTKFAASKGRGLQFKNTSSTLSRIFKAVGIGPMDSDAEIGNRGIQDGE